ncbi:hypothetical protein D3C78_1526930 [compost metagenome]
MEGVGPQGTLFSQKLIHPARAGGFQSANGDAKRLSGTQLDQPVSVIGHQYPGQQVVGAQYGWIFEAASGGTGGGEIAE